MTRKEYKRKENAIVNSCCIKSGQMNFDNHNSWTKSIWINQLLTSWTLFAKASLQKTFKLKEKSNDLFRELFSVLAAFNTHTHTYQMSKSSRSVYIYLSLLFFKKQYIISDHYFTRYDTTSWNGKNNRVELSWMLWS